MHIQIIVGSVRKVRVSLPIAKWLLDYLGASSQEHNFEILDLASWNLPLTLLDQPPAMATSTDPLAQQWARTLDRGDAFIFVAPEYNHGYSAAIKNALDLAYAEWRDKPAAFVSFGNAGGARGIEQLRLVVGELGMAALPYALHLRDVGSRLSGNRFSGSETEDRQAIRLLDQIASYGATLSGRRATMPGNRPSRRVLVVGASSAMNERVVNELRIAGIEATGWIVTQDEPGDLSGYDIVAFGRSLAGSAADRLKCRILTRNQSVTFVDAIGPVAVRQILTAVYAQHSERRLVSAFDAGIEGRNLAVKIAAETPCRARLRLFTRAGDELAERVIAELSLEIGTTALAIGPAPANAYSIILDVSGTEFHHQSLTLD